MKAKRRSSCTVCREPIAAGEEIGALLGKWVHSPCKSADIERRAGAAQARTELPPAPPEKRPQYVATRRIRQAGLAVIARPERR